MIDDPQIDVPTTGSRPVSRWRTIMGGHPDDSHRHGYRFRTAVSARCQFEGQEIACEAENISRSGALLVGAIPGAEGQILDLGLRAPSGTLTIQLRAKVARIRANPEGAGLQLAVEFIEMDDARREALEVLLARILETPVIGPLESLKPGTSPQEIRKTLEGIPISQRIALSSRAGARDREFLRLDANPAVLEALAHNPHLLVTEARQLAASSYLMSGTLDALSADPRFKGDEELRMAIAVHPRVSLATAEKVTAELKVPQIKKLLSRPGLNQVIRERLFRRTTRG
jgi:hypothetical protein